MPHVQAPAAEQPSADAPQSMHAAPGAPQAEELVGMMHAPATEQQPVGHVAALQPPESTGASTVDVSGTEVSGTDVSGIDVSGVEVSATDVSGMDVSATVVSAGTSAAVVSVGAAPGTMTPLEL